ncbi:recombinase [Frondihabitans sp. PAMC 28766]|uniref:YqaJ viral recombinase family protein n=1 Tax=Frondihabitans sp. PAMC 28766 TaxID=1795630 RepID=UPI00078E1B1B|nr:YqaJ viral recombinase family protein [Frondihabitans sp. PAMC 28766]AMM22540.1 recombinase [Frondihabitans sp. PAMC 28766]
MQPTLSLWDEPSPSARHTDRILADSTDRVAWLRARSRGITATDVARLSSAAAVQAIVLEKRYGSSFSGNAYTDHGRAREPDIAAWVKTHHSIEPSTKLFHARGQKLHLATPDGVGELADGTVVLAEIKTTSKVWRGIPRSYLRQVWWQQYVLGAERTLVVWEQHVDFVPVAAEPLCRWVERDDDQIQQLIFLADQVLDALAS